VLSIESTRRKLPSIVVMMSEFSIDLGPSFHLLP
jgi:hypothetical protein